MAKIIANNTGDKDALKKINSTSKSIKITKDEIYKLQHKTVYQQLADLDHWEEIVEQRKAKKRMTYDEDDDMFDV